MWIDNGEIPKLWLLLLYYHHCLLGEEPLCVVHYENEGTECTSSNRMLLFLYCLFMVTQTGQGFLCIWYLFSSTLPPSQVLLHSKTPQIRTCKFKNLQPEIISKNKYDLSCSFLEKISQRLDRQGFFNYFPLISTPNVQGIFT